MKIFLALILALFLLAAMINNDLLPPSNPLEQIAVKGNSSLCYASLLATEPESKIEIPIRKLSKKQIADTFGAPRGTDRQHQGQDIFAPRNTPVFSATKGYVWRIGENKLGGKTIWILGAGGRVYYYAHLEKYAENLKTGDEVSTDTVLGYVGDSGNAQGTPTHLHFGVYAAGGTLNPLNLF